MANARQLTAGHFARFVRRVPITQTAQEIGTEQTNALELARVDILEALNSLADKCCIVVLEIDKREWNMFVDIQQIVE